MDITTMISQLGFPIVCVLGLAAFCMKAFDTITTSSKEREERLYNTIAENQEMLAKLTEINATFASSLESHEATLERMNDDINEIKNIIKRRHEDDAK